MEIDRLKIAAVSAKDRFLASATKEIARFTRSLTAGALCVYEELTDGRIGHPSALKLPKLAFCIKGWTLLQCVLMLGHCDGIRASGGGGDVRAWSPRAGKHAQTEAPASKRVRDGLTENPWCCEGRQKGHRTGAEMRLIENANAASKPRRRPESPTG